MTTTAPDNVTVTDEGARLIIVVRPPRDYIYLAAYFAGLAFCAAMIVMPLMDANRKIFHPVGPLNTALAIAFLVGFPLYLALAILWALTGREIVTIAAGEIAIRREIAGLGFSRRLPLARLGQVFLVRDRPSLVPRMPSSPRVRGGPICLQEKTPEISEHDRSAPLPPITLRFGAGLSLVRAREIAALIRSHSGLPPK
jgi:hypothetical protein